LAITESTLESGEFSHGLITFGFDQVIFVFQVKNFCAQQSRLTSTARIGIAADGDKTQPDNQKFTTHVFGPEQLTPEKQGASLGEFAGLRQCQSWSFSDKRFARGNGRWRLLDALMLASLATKRQ
jgi:hypothetical protein